MDSQTIIDIMSRDIKDKTILIRLYNLGNGVDVWIDGLCWRNYDFDLVDYLREEMGIVLDLDEKQITYDIMDSSDDFIKKTCFNERGVFSRTLYDDINSALVEFDEDVIDAALALGITVTSINRDMYRGKWCSFVAFVEDSFKETSLYNIPEEYRKYIDYEKVAEDWEQDYYFCNGHVFDAAYR